MGQNKGDGCNMAYKGCKNGDGSATWRTVHGETVCGIMETKRCLETANKT